MRNSDTTAKLARARTIGHKAYMTTAVAAPSAHPEIRDMVSGLAVGEGAAAIFAAFTKGYQAAADEAFAAAIRS